MSTLREISVEYQLLLAMMEEGDVDYDVVQDTLDGIMGEFEDKAEACIVVMDELTAKAKKFKDEAKRLSDMAKTMENNAKRIKDNLEYVMIQNDIKSLETEWHKLRIAKNPDSVKIDCLDMSMIPEEYRATQEIKPDKKKILAAIKNGEEIDFAHIVSGSSLRIR